MSSRRRWLGLAALFVGCALWFAPELWSRVPGPDEIAYFQGFELSMHGASPIGDLGTAVPFLPWNPAFHAAIPLVAAVLLTRVAARLPHGTP
ncbi:MAG TPA: hypothetical protein VF395_05390 [Polyangiaceae bacterium]